jgi:hypothetical protein
MRAGASTSATRVRRSTDAWNRLRKYVAEHADSFIDLRKRRLKASHDHRTCIGYVNQTKNSPIVEYNLAVAKIAEICGSLEAWRHLAKELQIKTILLSDQRRHVLKRAIYNDGSRTYVVAIRADAFHGNAAGKGNSPSPTYKETKKATSRPNEAITRSRWSGADNQLFREMAGSQPAKAIARTLKRTIHAIWDRATLQGISLKVSSPRRRTRARNRGHIL